MPPALASHFGSLISGLGPSSLPFGPTYKLYLRACLATEHLLLAYIQNSNHELPLGVELPPRLKGWIRGYPSMLPRTLEGLEWPRPNQRMIPIASIRRNVRLSSDDLVQNATTWLVRTRRPYEPIAGFDRPFLKPSLGTPPSVGSDKDLPFLPLDPHAEVLQFSVPIERPDTWSEHPLAT